MYGGYEVIKMYVKRLKEGTSRLSRNSRSRSTMRMVEIKGNIKTSLHSQVFKNLLT
jgi:hypothetical protein